MVRYFYAWTPLGIVLATGVLLCSPLALIALMVVPLAAVAAIAWAVLSVSSMLSRAVSRGWEGRSGASPRTAMALAPARHQGA